MEIIHRKLSELWPYAKNARTHSESQIQEIANSIKTFGFNNPVLIDEKQTLIAGHGRVQAAKKLGLESIPTIQLSHLTEAQKKAYILADNRIQLNADWNYELLKVEFEEIEKAGIDLSLTGFEIDEIENYLNPEVLNEGLADPDSVPKVEELPISKPGDIWLLGKHRLLCGDSTEVTAVDRLVGEMKPILMVTDPPYGVNYDAEWRDKAELGVGERTRGKVENDNKVDWTDSYLLFNGDVTYIWHAGIYSANVAQHLIQCDFEIVSQIIWVKQHFALSRGDYHWQHEPCWYAVRKGKKHNWQGKRDQATTWDIKNNNSFGNANPEETWGHSTQKPLECMSRPIQNNTKPNDVVYDPFGGSGTTLIACEKLGRICLMVELSPQYCDVIVKRWQKFTQKKAILESTKKTFDEVANG